MSEQAAAKVTGAHLGRPAYPYVRQSTLRQVLTNTESAARQYALRQKAIALGWPAEQIITIDTDQGQSGASAADREGFQHLVAEVGMGLNFCAREDSDRQCRHNPRTSSQARMSSGVVSARWAGQWSRPIEGSFVEVEVAELWRGLDALVAEPERDYAGVDAGCQEPHGGGVSQYVAVSFFSPMLGH